MTVRDAAHVARRKRQASALLMGAMRRRLYLAALLVGVLPVAAQAQSRQAWDVTLGGGAVLTPTFEGSDRNTVSPIPLVNVTWKGIVSLGYDGLSASWRHGRARIGGGLTFDAGRDDQEGNGLWSTGDDRLKGLGKVDLALGVKIFGAYALGPIHFDVSATKFNGQQNDGSLVSFGAAVPLTLTDQLTVTPRVGATWADQRYLQTYFGVTASQAATSTFRRFESGGGLKDVSAGFNATYRLNAHWFAMVNITVKELMGDAATSPISFSDTNVTAVSMVGYHF